MALVWSVGATCNEVGRATFSTFLGSAISDPKFIPAHPLHLLFILFNATLMPIPGHSGHLEALGNEYHWIHHHCFSHNYGSPSVPFDKLFGTHFQFAKAGEKKKE